MTLFHWYRSANPRACPTFAAQACGLPVRWEFCTQASPAPVPILGTRRPHHKGSGLLSENRPLKALGSVSTGALMGGSQTSRDLIKGKRTVGMAMDSFLGVFLRLEEDRVTPHR